MTDDRSFAIETPIGSVKSDSGNHFTDVFSVLFIVLFMFLFKEYVKRYFK
jgi:hypothetical protein